MLDSDVTTLLGLIVLAGAALGALGRFIIMPIIRAIRFVLTTMETIEGHTKQLTTNGGGHLADAVRRTESKVDGFDRKWDERQAALDTALEVQQQKVAADLDRHRGEVATEFGAVWKELATRDVHKSVEELHAAADRAEAAAPRVEN